MQDSPSKATAQRTWAVQQAGQLQMAAQQQQQREAKRAEQLQRQEQKQEQCRKRLVKDLDSLHSELKDAQPLQAWLTQLQNCERDARDGILAPEGTAEHWQEQAEACEQTLLCYKRAVANTFVMPIAAMLASRPDFQESHLIWTQILQSSDVRPLDAAASQGALLLSQAQAHKLADIGMCARCGAVGGHKMAACNAGYNKFAGEFFAGGRSSAGRGGGGGRGGGRGRPRHRDYEDGYSYEEERPRKSARYSPERRRSPRGRSPPCDSRRGDYGR